MFWRYNFLSLLWAVMILVLTLIPGKYMPDTSYWDFLRFDKLVHMFLFGVLSFLMMRGLLKQAAYPALRNHAVLISILFSIVYGLLIEIFQTLVPGRSFELFDAVADTLGAFIGYLAFSLLSKRLALK